MSLSDLKGFKFLWVIFSLLGFAISNTVFAESERIIYLKPKWQVDIPQYYEIYQIATDGERMVVGVCDRYPSRDDRGAVHVFTRDGDEWKKSNIIQLDHDRSQTFGCAVAISGDLLVVGEVNFAKKKGEGAVHVFRLQNGEWTKESTIPFPRSSNHWLTGFGENVAILNGDIIVPARVYWAGFLSGRKTSGEVYIFGQTGKNWKLTQTLMPFENRDAQGFGKSIVVSNDILAVGSSRDVQSGIVYLFQKRGKKWVALDSLSPPQEKVYFFGEKIAVSDNYLVSSYYSAPIYIYKRQSEKFDYDSVIAPSETSVKYYRALVCDSLIAIEGEKKLNDKETYFVDVFEKSNGSWIKQARLISQLVESKWIGTGMTCVKEGIVMADLQGNIYAVDRPIK